MRCRITPMMIVIMAFGQAARGFSSREDEAAKNDDLGVGDRCENLSPYTKDQLAKHIKLNTRDLTKLKDSIDTALTDLQEKVTLLSEQRDQDRKKIEELERTLSDNKREITDRDNKILEMSKKHYDLDRQLQERISNLSEQRDQDRGKIDDLKSNFQEHANEIGKHMIAARMVEKVSTTKSTDITVVPNFNSIIIKKSTSGYVTTIFGGVDTIDAFSVRHLAGRHSLFMMGWSCVDEVESSYTYLGSNGWLSAGIFQNGHVYYYKNKEINSSATGLSIEMGRSGITTKVDRINKTITFTFGSKSLTKSFAELNLSTCKKFYPAVSLYYADAEIVIEDIIYTV